MPTAQERCPYILGRRFVREIMQNLLAGLLVESRDGGPDLPRERREIRMGPGCANARQAYRRTKERFRQSEAGTEPKVTSR